MNALRPPDRIMSRKRRGYPLGRAVDHIARNMAMNVARSVYPEPYVDRRGRLCGNILALRDLIAGRMIPERILDLYLGGVVNTAGGRCMLPHLT
jgi:hypothetical protein